MNENIETIELRIEELASILARDVGRIPCGHVRTADDAAWWALAMAFIYWNANGPSDSDAELLDHYLGDIVNGTDGVHETIVDGWYAIPTVVRERLAVDGDVSDFVDEWFDHLVSDDELDETIRHYLVAALWSSSAPDDHDGPGDGNGHMDKWFDPDDHDGDDDTYDDVRGFIASCLPDIKASGLSWEQVGHDFWLTRNGHGAGFWDRGLGAVGDRLSEAARVYGSAHPFPTECREPTDEEGDRLRRGDFDADVDLDGEFIARDLDGWSIYNYNDGKFTIE